MQRIAASIETQDGRVITSPENLAAVAALVAAMRNDFIDDEIIDAITEYVQSFDTISQDIIDAFAEFDNLDPELVTALDRAFKTQTASTLLAPETYERSLWNSVANSMIYAVAVGAPVSEMLGSVSNIVEAGAVTQATAAVVESAPMMLQRTATAAVAEQVGAEFFLYQGRPLRPRGSSAGSVRGSTGTVRRSSNGAAMLHRAGTGQAWSKAPMNRPYSSTLAAGTASAIAAAMCFFLCRA
jgi:hypothetical protein